MPKWLRKKFDAGKTNKLQERRSAAQKSYRQRGLKSQRIKNMDAQIPTALWPSVGIYERANVIKLSNAGNGEEKRQGA